MSQLIAAERAFEEQFRGVPVHYLDIHLEKGMHCVDCHFVQDVHGNGRLQMEVRAGCEIQCVELPRYYAGQRPTLRLVAPRRTHPHPMARAVDLTAMRTPFDAKRLRAPRRPRLPEFDGRARPAAWEVTQTVDVIDPTRTRALQREGSLGQDGAASRATASSGATCPNSPSPLGGEGRG